MCQCYKIVDTLLNWTDLLAATHSLVLSFLNNTGLYSLVILKLYCYGNYASYASTRNVIEKKLSIFYIECNSVNIFFQSLHQFFIIYFSKHIINYILNMFKLKTLTYQTDFSLADFIVLDLDSSRTIAA